MAGASVPTSPDRGPPWPAVLVTMPAHPCFLATLQAAVGAFVAQVGGSPACRRELQLATDEAAAVLIEDAMPWTEIRLVITYDDEDVYVRVVSRRAQPGRWLATEDLTSLLLDGVVESYALFADGQRGYAILQTSQDGVGTQP